MEFDVLIKNGFVLDGTGSAPFPAQVGIRGDVVEAVDQIDGTAAARVIDATGMIVAPGFIDTHTHSDLACFLGPDHAVLVMANARQGVTTEVCGNCGFSPFPAPDRHRQDVERNVAALLGGAPLNWHDLAGYAAAAEGAGLPSNLAPLAGLGTLRAAVVGFEDRLPEPHELRSMQRLAEECLEQGALGISSGLIYAPGVFASTAEIITVSKSLARFGRPYVSHIRGESYHVVDSVLEAIQIGRELGVPVHISHHKAAGKANWGRTHETLAIIESAQRQGIDVTTDAYPYTIGSTILHALLPPWAQTGGIDAMVERLSSAAVRDQIRTDLAGPPADWENLYLLSGWKNIRISNCPGAPELEGKTILELASNAGKDELTFVLDLLVAQPGKVTMTLDILDEGDVRNVLQFPSTMIGSDGIPLPGKPHPRWAGSFARVLGSYSRQEGVLGLAEAVHKMTGLAADRFSLQRRGYLKPGNYADVVVFDPNTIIDRATFADPLQAPEGVAYVMVNGQIVVDGSISTGAKPGRVLTAN